MLVATLGRYRLLCVRSSILSPLSLGPGMITRCVAVQLSIQRLWVVELEAISQIVSIMSQRSGDASTLR